MPELSPTKRWNCEGFYGDTAFISKSLWAIAFLHRARKASKKKKPVYKAWWLWTVVGLVVAGAAVGVALGVTKPIESSPDTTNDYTLP